MFTNSLCKLVEASQVMERQVHLPKQETQETQVQSLGQEGALEEGMATHSSILARIIPWTEETGGLYSIELKRVR